MLSLVLFIHNLHQFDLKGRLGREELELRLAAAESAEQQRSKQLKALQVIEMTTAAL